MATINNTTYCAKDSQEFYVKALLNGETVQNIRVIPNVKVGTKVGNWSFAGLLQQSDCEFNPTNNTLSNKELNVCSLKVNTSLCMTDLEAAYFADSLLAGNTLDLPSSIEQPFLDVLQKEIANELEILIWQGDTAGSPESVCDGFLKKFLADNTVIDVTGTTITSSNVIAELGKAYAAIPAGLIMRLSELRLFVSPTTAQAYRIAQMNQFAGYNSAMPLEFAGIPMVVTAGMPSNQMVIADKNNLWFGTDVVNDISDIIVEQDRKTNSINFVGNFKVGVQYGVGAEVVYYH